VGKTVTDGTGHNGIDAIYYDAAEKNFSGSEQMPVVQGGRAKGFAQSSNEDQEPLFTIPVKPATNRVARTHPATVWNHSHHRRIRGVESRNR
jgi:hypothetical protein